METPIALLPDPTPGTVLTDADLARARDDIDKATRSQYWARRLLLEALARRDETARRPAAAREPD